MSKHTVDGFITYRDRWGKKEVDFLTYDPRQFDHNDRIVVSKHSIEVELPDDFDPRQEQVALLRAEQAKLRAAFAVRVKQLDDQINSLLAIENTVEAA